MALCLAVYYFAPFLRYDRGPNAPDQAILIDMVGRRAYWFFIEIWPQEVYFLTGILVLAAITMFFATSLFGRVWCGYFCFQTVWTDLFIWVERVVQGDSADRKKLDDKRFSFEWFWKKALTHIAWLSIGLFTGGAFVLYFNDAPTLVRQIMHGEVTSTTAGFIFGLTFSTYIMAGFAREQVCTFMCPYARFQSAMFDEDSLIIAYDKLRGEPRGKHKKGESWDGHGHCVDCTQCVQVCPTGIDIRDGLQIQCIACGLCIDACDSVMEKVGLPKGLIRYDTERNLKEMAEAAAAALNKPQTQPVAVAPREALEQPSTAAGGCGTGTCSGGSCSVQNKAIELTSHRNLTAHLIRPRTIWYSAILLTVISALLFAILSRTTLELNVIRDRNPLYVQLSTGEFRNGYTLHILNKTLEERTFRLSIEGIDGATITMAGAGDTDPNALTVKPDSVGNFRLFVAAPRPSDAHAPMVFTITPLNGDTPAHRKSVFISGGVN